MEPIDCICVGGEECRGEECGWCVALDGDLICPAQYPPEPLRMPVPGEPDAGG